MGSQPFGSKEGEVWHKGRAGWSDEKRKGSMHFGRSVWGHETEEWFGVTKGLVWEGLAGEGREGEGRKSRSPGFRGKRGGS